VCRCNCALHSVCVPLHLLVDSSQDVGLVFSSNLTLTLAGSLPGYSGVYINGAYGCLCLRISAYIAYIRVYIHMFIYCPGLLSCGCMLACHRRIAGSNPSTATLLLPSARIFKSVHLLNWLFYSAFYSFSCERFQVTCHICQSSQEMS